MLRRSFGALLAGSALSVAIIGAANAGAFAIREQSATGMGSAFAGVGASGGGLSGMFWNPAVVTSVGGRNSEWNVFGILPSATMSNFTGTYEGLGGPGDVGVSAVVTSSYSNYQLNDKVFIGLSVTHPFGLSTSARRGWGGEFSNINTDVMSVNIAPTIGYKINNQLSVGFAAELQWAYINSTGSHPALADAGHPLSKITGDGIAPGFAVGLNWEPMKGTSIGLGYRSFIRHQISAYQTYDAAFPGGLGGTKHGVRMNLTTPESVTLSGRQAITDKFTALGTIEYTHWGREGVVPVVGSPTGSSFVLNYKDGWFFALGGEYKHDPKWTLRGGVAYEVSPVQAADRTMRLPDNDRWWFTGGASYAYSDRLTLDASYAYISVKESFISQSTSSFGGATYSGTSHANLHIIGLSARYAWDKPAAPVVSKY